MLSRTRPLPLLLALVLPAVLGSWNRVDAGKPGCQNCGCTSQLKTVRRLVRTCQRVEIPEYACTKQEVFFPDKGAVCKSEFRCDTFTRLDKTCDCTIVCTCRTVCGHKTAYGAASTGCHVSDAVRQPAGAALATIPLLRWETVHLCGECCNLDGRSGK